MSSKKPLLLKGRAYTFFLTRPQATKTDYQLLTTALQTEFDAPEIQYHKRQELHRIQQNGDSISTYLARVEKLSRHLNITNETQLDIMIAGLNPKYRQYIQMKIPKTYSALLLKEAVSPPELDDVMRHVLETVQSIKENQDRKPDNHTRQNWYDNEFRRDSHPRNDMLPFHQTRTNTRHFNQPRATNLPSTNQEPPRH